MTAPLSTLAARLTREAALAPALVTVVVALVGAFYTSFTPALQGEVTALATAGAGIVTALLVQRDRLAPTILGLMQAAFSLLLGLGLQVTPYSQATIMTAVSALIGMYVRTQVDAPVPAIERLPMPPRSEHVPPAAADRARGELAKELQPARPARKQRIIPDPPPYVPVPTESARTTTGTATFPAVNADELARRERSEWLSPVTAQVRSRPYTN